MLPIYRFDPVSRISWLEFDGKPEQSVIDLLKKEGWRWAGYRKQWHTNRRFAKPPVDIGEYEDGGECDYSSERPERLQNASIRASERSEQAYERSNELVDGIPLGQPIITGRHSGRQQERVLEQSRNQMEKSAQEEKKAEHLEYKARSSASHQAYKEKPDVIARRIKRLKGEVTSIKNDRARSIQRVLWDVQYKSITAEEAKEKIARIKVAQQDIVEHLEAEVAENEQALQEAGGLVADNLDIQIGDVIRGRWQGLNEVTKINKRNGEVLSYTCRPLENTWCKKYVIPKDQVRGVAVRKDDVSSLTILQAKGEGRSYTPEPKPEKEEKQFKVQEVQTVEVYNNTTSLFPIPTAIADQLVQGIPSDAYLILEPSAGTGSLVHAATRLLFERGQNHAIHCCEILPQLRRSLTERGYQIVGENFLQYSCDWQYDCVIANPPFANTEWLDHVEHMLELLKPGGRLIVILPQGFVFRQDKHIKAFRELVEANGFWQELPRDTFVESGTSVATVLVTMVKPQEDKVEEAIPVDRAEAVSLWGD